MPFVAKQKCFALKGGTAINLFVRDFPRLPVDIDLVYLPMKLRSDALQEICDALDAISADLKIAFKDVELSPVLRGTVYEPKLMEVC
ncbi:nucleotidyl transferase AbiEii/AbiGii toxin family protein [Shewanella phaeophyticola]|uniref:Nucleotidyl transferase AbiEii/AbiGii toxin family protein n=1 Tax=Shewanella phaeophyticola TaxID=2978345 RepID=A0ABT2NZG6_9GAMM|nr:nucleotidyl transferase AbiEii/AbiGii toxin family protein [Shewanella sp. KJ10-1]MCT8985778.1 nucleotidyl transferase AbiEii/AbiGii toxin family protein [Shewanella sp. KJ10-1]